MLSGMGFVKQMKANKLADEAREAWQRGDVVFAAMLNTPTAWTDWSGAIPGWPEMIAAIEGVGWVMVEWTASSDRNGRPQAYPLFRRGVTR
jgi:hypothetical protein